METSTLSRSQEKEEKLTLRQGQHGFFEELESLAVLHSVAVKCMIFAPFSLALI